MKPQETHKSYLHKGTKKQIINGVVIETSYIVPVKIVKDIPLPPIKRRK